MSKTKFKKKLPKKQNNKSTRNITGFAIIKKIDIKIGISAIQLAYKYRYLLCFFVNIAKHSVQIRTG